ncbi:MAG: hypothetical protein WAW13_00850 [Minisyncoccia bacterium]
MRSITSAALSVVYGEDPDNPDSEGLAECEWLANLLHSEVPENLLVRYVLNPYALHPQEMSEMIDTYLEGEEPPDEALSEWLFDRFANALKKLCVEQGIEF